MKFWRYKTALASALVALLLATACMSSRFSTDSDYDRSVNVRNFETFAVVDSMAITGSSANPTLVNDFNRQRFVEAVQKQMVVRGYKDSKQPDLVAVLKLRSRNRTQSNYMPAYSPWGYGWGMGYGGFGNTYTTSYEEVLVSVDLRMAASGRLLWQGVVSGKQDDFLKKADKRIPEAIGDLFMKFPDGRPKSNYDPMDNRPRSQAVSRD